MISSSSLEKLKAGKKPDSKRMFISEPNVRDDSG
jgi:hypothetical protein